MADDEEYESDPEQAKLSLKMRRREASDDEEEEEHDDEVLKRRIDSSRVSDSESDGQGAAAEYDDDEESDIDEEELEEELEEEEEDEYEEGGSAGGVEAAPPLAEQNLVGGGVEVNPSEEGRREIEKVEGAMEEGGGFYEQDGEQFGENEINGGGEEEEKKENEPFAVPTAGAFYMHDDRFRDSAGGRHRRTLGGRKLWESKDDKKWGHDKFEELTMQERHYDEGRRASRGRNRARGRNRGEDRGYSRGGRAKTYNNNNINNNNNISNTNNNQSNAPKTVRGRGPRRYQPSMKNYDDTPTQTRQSGKPVEKTSHASSGRASVVTSSSESAQLPARKNVFASSLNSASPPFYPSGSSNKEINLTLKKDSQAAPINRNSRPPVMGESFSMPQSSVMRGKNVADIGMDKLYIDDSSSGKPLANLPLPASGPSFITSTQPPQSRAQGRGPNPLGQMAYQATVPPHNQVNRVPSPTQAHAFQRAPIQNRLQPNLQSSGQQLGHRSGGGSQASSPPKTSASIHSLESTDLESTLESSNSKTALVGKGKGSIQGSGISPFPYAGGPVMGASGSMTGGHSDPNFPATPAFLPVMQFGGQHPGGIGVPAVGMAFPGYVAQPNGMGNSEMTWLPVLAGAGALGQYCSPYITVDGAYHGRPSGQTSSLAASSKDNNSNRSGNEVKPSQRPELANDELGQRQNKARRYTEMKFDQ